MKNLQGNLFSLVVFPRLGETTHDFYERCEWAFSACEVNRFRASYIYHDEDRKEDGTRKVIHAHFVIFTKTKRLRFSTLLNLLGFDEFYQTEDGGKKIEIEPCISLAIGKDEIGLTRYLIHFDEDESKYLYNAFDIETTNWDFVEFALAEGAKIQDMDMYTLIDFAKHAKGFIEFLKTMPQYYVAQHMYFLKELYRSVHEERLNKHE